MAEATGGSYWLKNKLLSILEERKEYLAEGTAEGVPDAEYRQMVGRYRECKRMKGVVEELFAEFYADEENIDEDLEEMTDEESGGEPDASAA